MAADQRENISTAPAPSLPARPHCHSYGRSPWRTKEARSIRAVTWTVSVTGIRIITLIIRTRCTGLRWCEWTVIGHLSPSGCAELAGASRGLLSEALRRPCLYSLYFVCVLNFRILTTRNIKEKKGGGGVISLQASVAGSDISETWVCVCSLKDILDKRTFFKYTVSVRLLY